MNWFELYANAGISVLPIKTDGSKAPAISSWGRLQLEIASDRELAEWGSKGYGVGIVGGRVSGGLEVIDIDDPSLARPFCEALRETDERIMHLVTFVATPRRDPETGKSGVHILYRCSEPDGNQKLAMSEPLPQFDENGEVALNPVTGDPISRPETLIETRGEGGYVLTVGSPASCHPSGNEYEHRLGCRIEELQRLTDEQRETLLQVARSFDRSVIATHTQVKHESDSDSPGNKFAQVTSWEEILEPHGWTKAGASGSTQRWCRPGKSKGYSATTGLVSSHGSDLFCVFSTNAHPFPGPTSGGACSTHSKFDAYTRLNFDGDYSRAAKHLAGEGFGQAPPKREEPPKPIAFETWDSITIDYLTEIETGVDPTINTGIDSLDEATGGVAFGELVIIGGRPSHGKTLVALQIADNLATQSHSSLLISEEMSHHMLSKRRLHMASEIAEDRWRSNLKDLTDDYKIFQANKAPVYIAPQCGTIGRAVEVIDKAASEHDMKVVVVDYAQLLRGRGGTRYEQVTDVSQQLREAASRHGLLLLMLCQLNRGSERSDSRPRSIDLRDSGQLEQDADVVLLVDWPKMRGDTECEWDDYFVYVEKNRNRETFENKVCCKIAPRRQRIKSKKTSYEWQP